MRWIYASVPAAVCLSSDGARRASATCLLAGSLAVPGALREAATTIAFDDAAPGRVVSGGTFGLPEAHAALAVDLGPALARGLRRSFEWYVCRGAFFHNDAHYGGVLFGAWCAAGPRREIAFSRPGLRVPAAPGDWLVFDPFEPHAVLDPGATVEALSADGQVAPAGSALARVSGNARAVLTAERTALNLLGRLCGIATLTQDYVDAVQGTKARITDTRKTTTSELTMALMLALNRRLVVEAGSLNSGGWQKGLGRDLAGLTLGLIGLGHLRALCQRRRQPAGQRL